MHSIPQSLNTLSLHDALPICFMLAGKIVEYMLAGRPMVCYASGIGEDLVDGRDALLLDPYTPETVERQLLRAADPTLRETLGRNARALARDWFDVAPPAGRMAEFYRTCLTQAAQRARG